VVATAGRLVGFEPGRAGQCVKVEQMKSRRSEIF